MTGARGLLPRTETQWNEVEGLITINAGEVWVGSLVRIIDGRCFEITKIETSEEQPPFLTGKQLLPAGEHMTFFDEVDPSETGFSSTEVIRISLVRGWL